MKQDIGEQELLERLGALPLEITPGKDVWPAIAERIGYSSRRQSSSRWWLRATAASVAVAFVAGMLLGRQWGTPPEMAQPGFDRVTQATALRAGGLPGALAASEFEYQAAFREFISVGDPRENLPPQTSENLTAGWAELREAETALANALRDNPGNSFLSAKMLELRSRQLDFLKQIASLDQNIRRSTI